MTNLKKCNSCGFKGDYGNVSRVSIYKHNLRFDLCFKCMKKLGVGIVTEFVEKEEKQQKLIREHREKIKAEFKERKIIMSLENLEIKK